MVTVTQGIMLEILALYPGSSPAEKRGRSLGTRLRNYISNQNLQFLEWCRHTQPGLDDHHHQLLLQYTKKELPVSMTSTTSIALHKLTSCVMDGLFSC